MKITYLFASRSRPEKFFAALSNIQQLSYHKNYEVMAVLDEDDPSMNNDEVKDKLKSYTNVKPFFGISKGKIHAINREVANIPADTDIICVHSEDMVFIKQDYDLDILAAFADGFNGLVHFPDQVQHQNICTYAIISKAYLDFFGYIYNPKYNSLYADLELQEVAKKINKYRFVGKKILEHRHHLWGFGKPDSLAKIDGPDMVAKDKKTYFEYKNIAIVTSLSPSHANKEQQHIALKSWCEIGECYSLNEVNEMAQLKPIYNDITFIETKRTIDYLIGKKLVTINAMIDFAIITGRDLLIVNSDVLLYDMPELLDDGITIFSRYDYTDNFMDSTIFAAGFDAIYVPNKFLNIFPPSVYAMGAAFWDYALPYQAIISDVPLYYPFKKCAFHKLHETQYSFQEWCYIGEYFRWQFKLGNNLSIPQVATQTLAIIKSKLITI